MIEFQLTDSSALPVLVMLIIAAGLSLAVCFYFLWCTHKGTRGGRVFATCLTALAILTSLQVLVWHMYFHSDDHRHIDFTGILAAWCLGFAIWIGITGIHSRINRLSSRFLTVGMTAAAALYVFGFAAAANHYSLPQQNEINRFASYEFKVQREAAFARTDKGTIIPLSSRVKDEESMIAMSEATQSQVYGLASRAMFRDSGSPDSNCHGWVFAGGEFIIHGSDVKTILAENGYSHVVEPAIDDVVIYCNEGGDITHTAIVRGFMAGGQVLVEGKWGANGVYMHIVDEQPYGRNFSFHRTTRPNHKLIIEKEDSVSRPIEGLIGH